MPHRWRPAARFDRRSGGLGDVSDRRVIPFAAPARIAEEQRFRRDVPASWEAVHAAERYLHSLGGLWTLVRPSVMREDFNKRNGFGDDCDLFVCKRDPRRFSHRWWPVEVKGRGLDFTCADDYPYDTIFVDRSAKVDLFEPYAYFILNSTLSCAALIKSSTKGKWIGPKTYPDRPKGYPVCVYECPKDVAEFVSLKRLPAS
jgi:hypothetical protein